ncbi:ABC transporter substrate-binding protein [Halosolutus gelatinilyticus]|uniref:ABC transporter substrate-binding protein n=1 Tax=Halosolutus gelatinilyticus TaxID=2931975 RepID=UPI001FF54578|nr:ABC transporter substrate-binding protein [Halosolutus gelatinilyticus]
MDEDGTSRNGITRRDAVRYGSAVVGGGVLAGCMGTEPNDGEDERGGAAASSDGSYTVEMEPVGEIAFDDVPETWFPYTADYADMGVALGRGDGLLAIGVRARYGTHLYEELPGVSIDGDGLTELWQGSTGKEIFYELDADLHVIDPNFMVNQLGWSQEDVDEIDDTVGPFFGNTIFTRVYDWHDYADYSMYEAFEKLAEVFRERDRYEAFAQYHDDVLADVRSRLPDETPDVAVLYPAEVPPESFYPYLVGAGTQSKHWNDLRVGDALAKHGFEDAQADGGTIDYEGLLEIDPDVIAIRLQGEITPAYFEDEIVSHLRGHDIASELRAVQNDRVVYGGLTYQGPIIHLFQLERAARELYPDEFDGERLFDRRRVADIVTGTD